VLVSLVPFIVLAILLVFAIALLASSVRVLREYQRGVVFRLGRLLGDPKGPGLFLLIPIVDRMVQVDLRTITLVVPPQDVITRDNVPAKAIDRHSPSARSPSSEIAGYFIVSFEPRFPSTHSIVAPSSATARFVTRL